MQPLTLEETALKEEMKSKCLSKGNYIDKNAKAKFEMLCHLEDFEVQYWELKKQIKKQKEAIDKVYEKCQPKRGSYDYDVWLKLNESWKTLSRFTEHIKYNLHPIITEAYQCDIKNSINEIIETTKYDVVFKKDILDILKEVSK